jgi:peptidoglycan hydrolase CwlO-like protein
MNVAIGQLLVGGSVGAILAALINLVANRRKLGADAAAVLSKAAAALVSPLQERIHELENDLDRMRDKAKRMENALDDCQRLNTRKESQITTLRYEVRELRRQVTGVAHQTQQLVDTNPNLRAVHKDEKP